MIIFLYGTDGYRIKENVDSVAGSYHKKHKSGVNFHTFDFDQRTAVKLAIASFTAVGDCFDGLYNAVKSVSFFDEVKLIVIRNAFYYTGLTSIGGLRGLIKDLDIVNDKNTVLLFAENKSKNELQKVDKELFSILSHKDNLVKEIDPLSGVKLSNWVKNRFKENGHNVSPAIVSLLIDIVGNESWALANEINKLSNYCTSRSNALEAGDRSIASGTGSITEKDVDLLVGRKEINNIFELTDAVGSQNKAKAFEMMYRLTNSGHDSHYLLSMLIYHFENLLSVCEGSAPKHLHPFVAKKAVSQAHRFSKEDLLSKFNYLAELDIASKNGTVNLEDELYNFVIS